MHTSVFTNSGRFKTRTKITAIALLVLLNCITRANAPIPRPVSVKTMPVDVGPFHLLGEAKELKEAPNESALPAISHLISTTMARYESADKTSLSVAVFKWDSDSAAFADVTGWERVNRRALDGSADRIGTASARDDRSIRFFKGPRSVSVTSVAGDSSDRVTEFARQFALTLDNGEGEIPVLVKHLPNWESVQNQVAYAISHNDLVAAVGNQPILNEVNFDGGAEAVTANYGQTQLVIVEFTTPQFSIENDSRIWTRIAELKSKGEPSPTAYRRVGNYSVFVFNSPDERAANALVDQVKYEQVVQWLGDDPHLAERLQRYLTQTSAGVLVAVLKSSGLSLVLCLAFGGLIGAILFRRRRAQRATAYSDAGGSIRLNLDDLTEPVKSNRLLKSAEPPEHSANS